MSWNYRLCKQTYRGEGFEEVAFEIREAYYNEAGDIWAITENPARPFGESSEEVKTVLERMMTALDKDVIDLDTFVFTRPDFENKDADIVQ
jgi:hypothetical protein